MPALSLSLSPAGSPSQHIVLLKQATYHPDAAQHSRACKSMMGPHVDELLSGAKPGETPGRNTIRPTSPSPKSSLPGGGTVVHCSSPRRHADCGTGG